MSEKIRVLLSEEEVGKKFVKSENKSVKTMKEKPYI